MNQAPASRCRHLRANFGSARVAAAAKARWAKIKAAKAGGKPAAKPVVKAAAPVKKKFKMSTAAKAKLSAQVKARWAKIKAAGKKSL